MEKSGADTGSITGPAVDGEYGEPAVGVNTAVMEFVAPQGKVVVVKVAIPPAETGTGEPIATPLL
jgi:hypothetical protein